MQPMDNLMQLAELRAPQVRDVRANLAGELVVPGDPSWDEARLAWHLAVDQRPEAVAIPENLHDVIEIVLWAREEGFRVAPQGTGHNAPALGDLAGTVLLKTHRMRGVAVDPVSRTARAEAGAIWIDVVKAAAEHGLAALAGSSPDVGVVGYTLGGGLSWLARKHGIGANQVTAIEVVTASGDIVRTDRENEPDLFWALRGGGGSFGVVTALEFELYPVPELYAGMLTWPWERTADVLHAWREWASDLPNEMSTWARVLQVPPLPEIPEPVRGRQLVVVEAAYLGAEEAGSELLRPLRDLGPELDTFAAVPPAALGHLHMDPEDPVPFAIDGQLLDDLPPAAIDAVV